MNIKQFLNLQEKNKKLDPFYKELNSKDVFKLLNGEIKEALEEFNKGNNQDLEKELGDVLWNTFLLLEKLEDEKKITKQKPFDFIVDKMSKRKSFLLEGRKVSKKEAMKIWNKAKSEEGYDNSRLWDGSIN